MLISWSASLGAYLWTGPSAWLNQHIFKAVVREEVVDREHFYWAMRHEIDHIAEAAHGSTMHHVTQKVFVNSTIPLPPLPEQRAIAHALRAVQDAIQARRRELDLERERKAALMQHLFTRGTRGEPTKQTSIGEMPESWQQVKLESVCVDEPQNGAFIKGPTWGSGIRYVNVVDAYPTVEVDIQTVQRLECDETTASRYALRPGDLLFVRSSLKREGVGQCCAVGALAEPAIFDCHLIRMTPQAQRTVPLFLAHYFLTEAGHNDLVARSKTTTMTTLNQKGLSETWVPLPSYDEQHTIADALAACDTKVKALEADITLHEELFRALLEELMTGRLSALPLVEDAEEAEVRA